MSLFNSFRILVGILLGPSLSWFKGKTMLETSVLSVGVITNDSIFKGTRYSKYFFLENMIEDRISIATLAKLLLKALAMPDRSVIVSLLTLIVAK